MTPAELIAHINELGGRIYLVENELKLKVPKSSLSDEFRAELSAQKQGIITFLKAAQSSSAEPEQKISPADRNKPLPASFSQQRLWFLDELEPGTSTFNMSWPMRLRGQLDVAALQAAINDLCARHESLRTYFTIRDTIPIQVIDPEVRLDIDYSKDQGADDTAISDWLTATSQIPFELNTAPLIRIHLRQTAADDHRLLIIIHHIVSDAWSMSILFHELTQLYAAHCRGESLTLPELPIQYADFSAWQRDWLQGAELERQLGYWEKQLAGIPPLLELPTDHPRPVVQTYAGSHIQAHVGTTLTAKLQALSRQHNASMFMLLQAALGIVLARYSGTEDIVIGTPIAGRRHTELEHLIGFFLNTLVMRTDVSGNPTFTELLQRVHQSTLSAYDHQDLPFEKLVEELRPERELSHSPIFQVLFNLRAQTSSGIDLLDLDVEFEVIERNTAKVDLALSVNEFKDGLDLSFEYNTDLFEDSTIDELARAFVNLLEAIAAQPDIPVGSLPLLENKDKKLRQTAEQTARPTTPFTEFPAAEIEQSISARFETIVNTCGSLPAAESATTVWTYSELNTQANAVAHKLLDSDLNPQECVGVLMSQDVPMLAALLGTLKAGMAYVPMDPESPPARHRQICADAGINLIITDSAHLEHATEVAAADIQLLAIDKLKLTGSATANPGLSIGPTTMAYVLFTSGSTGNPKGVMQSHRNVLHHCRTYTNSIHIDKSDRLSLLPPYGFDAAVMDIFGTLLNGACLQIFDLRNEADPAKVTQSIAANNVTIFHATPTVFRFLLEAAPDQDLSSVRLVVLGGEEARSSDFALFNKHFPADAVFVNGLGPSESTLTLQYFARHDTQLPGAVIPVGRPVNGTEIVLLNEAGNPTGIVGELAICSDYVTPGYWNEPQLTDAAFITLKATGQKAYRTGDQARYLPDGQLVFMGRKDSQIKLRGHRIETGEIETILLEHNDVQNCAVLLVKDKRDTDQLVAYLTTGDTHPAIIDTLRQSLREKLPAYMVPSAYVMLEKIPLTANGKLDRSAMPLPDWEAEAEYVAPTTAIEETLAAIWSDVLRIDKVGIHDDFFALGGHSLLATQLLARVREQLDIEPTLRSIFEAPTIAGFAVALETVGSNLASPEIGSCDRSSEIPQSFAQQRLWFLDQFEPGGSAYNLSQAVKLKGKLDLTCLQAAIDQIAARHESVRTLFSDGTTGPQQLIDDSLSIAVQLLPMPEADEASITAKISEIATKAFDLKKGPLVRMQLLKCSENEHVLIMTIHHIISDKWSLNILWRDLTRLYNEQLSGQKAALPRLPIQYADYSVWQQNWLSGAELERQLEYWKDQLNNIPAVLELPLDRPRPPQRTYRGDSVRWSLDNESSIALKKIASQQGGTMFMVLLAAFNVLLRRYTGSSDIVVGSPIAGRRHKEFEDLIGFFINTLVMRVDVDGNPTFRELLRHTRQTTLDAYDHQDLPFEKLVEELQPVRDRSHSPLFQVSFILQNAPGEPAAFEGLEAEGLNVAHGQSKFDLNLSCSDYGDDVRGLFEFNTDIFDRSTIDRMGKHFVRLLQSIALDPNCNIHDLQMLSAAELQQLVHDWNQTDYKYPQSLTVHEMFENQAMLQPASIALWSEGAELSYSELNHRANCVAEQLIAAGAGPGSLVAIASIRSADIIIGLLGILKSGAAYVPVDPHYPAERVRFMLEDSQAPILLTQSTLLNRLPETLARTICLDQIDWQQMAGTHPNPDSGVTADDLAYVIYTSGSTGKPKGVSIEHRNTVALMQWTGENFSTEELSGVLASTSVCFDLSVFEIFCTLGLGGRVVLVQNALTLPELPQETNISLINTVPSAISELVSINSIPASVKTVNLAGEPLTTELADSIYALGTVKNVNDLYGPSEDTTYSTWTRRDQGASPTIGRPIYNTQAYVLDAHGKPLPAGIPGELYLGGSGVTRGYLGRPELTAERYVPDSFQATITGRLYRTGDRVKHQDNGNLVYLGRIDHQIKLRGFRIELGEVEAYLRKHPTVNDAVVIVREDTPGDQRLVAYITIADTTNMNAEELRNTLRQQLPDYMVPAAYVALESIPLLPNGKVDRTALPAPSWESQQHYTAPRSPREKLLCSIWAKFLKIEKVGINDDFFDLGGHSLLTIKLIREIDSVTGEQLTIADIFENSTVEELSKLIPDKDWDVPEYKNDSTLGKLWRKLTRRIS